MRQRGISLDKNQRPKARVLKDDGLEYVPEMFKEAARAQEEQFAKLMIEQMNKVIIRINSDNCK